MAYIGKTPTAAPLTSSDVADGIITNAKLAQDIISGDTALAATPADTDELLISDAGTLKRIDYSYLKSTPGWNLIKTLTASSDSTLSFVNGTADVVLDSTYNVYVFTFTNIHGSIINYSLSFNGSTDAGSNYNVSKTQFTNRTWKCSGSSGAPTDDTGEALYQGTGFATMNNSIGIDADEQCSGQMWLYNPGSSTFGKMYECHTNNTHSSDCLYKWIVGGEIETTSAVDAIQFKLSTGNIDSGVISLYGISK